MTAPLANRKNHKASETPDCDGAVACEPGAFMRAVKGGVVIVDADDAHWVIDRKPGIRRAHASGYVIIKWNGKNRMLHRLILEAPDGVLVDHINGNFLDNRKANLRFCTHAENARNRFSVRGSISRFKGVTRTTAHKSKPWLVTMKIDGRAFHIGHFDNEVDAALAYDNVARKQHGEFARLNFPRAGEQSALLAPSFPRLVEHEEGDRP